MGAPSRISYCFNGFIGIGIGVNTFPYAFNITLVLPFISIDVGLGKPYTLIDGE